MKNKTVASILAFLLGIFGVHRFYLGKRFWGVLHLALFFITFIISIEEGAPAIMIPAILGFIDAVLLAVMPQEEFDEKYNSKYLYGRKTSFYDRGQNYNPKRREGHYEQQEEVAYFKKKGIQAFRVYKYEDAIDYFLQALEVKEDDPTTHFNLACSYSNTQNADKAFFHLEEALDLGFKQLEKIHTHEALSFLRSLPEFEAFVENDYRRPASLPEPKPDLIDDLESKAESEDLLDQIVKLGELRDKGILTDEEFTAQKRKILGE